VTVLYCHVYRQRYIMTSREVKRWDATSRSPVYASLSSTLKVRGRVVCCAVCCVACCVVLRPVSRCVCVCVSGCCGHWPPALSDVCAVHCPLHLTHTPSPNEHQRTHQAHTSNSTHTSHTQGLPTIRAYGAESAFQAAFISHLSLNGSWWFAYLAASRWIGFRLDTIATIVLGCAVLLAMLMRHSVRCCVACAVSWFVVCVHTCV
jgi:hypothetical protein